MKVFTVKEAWELANRLFPTDYELDADRSENAGYKIYHTTNKEMNAWISDLGDRLELNYPNGSSENIWIEEKLAGGATVIVGVWIDKTVFGGVTVKEVKEVTYYHTLGMVNKTLDDERFGIEISLSDGNTATFGCENVAYIRFE